MVCLSTETMMNQESPSGKSSGMKPSDSTQESRPLAPRYNISIWRHCACIKWQPQASTDSLDSAEDFKPVEINLGEIKEMLSMYKHKRRISVSALTGAGTATGPAKQ